MINFSFSVLMSIYSKENPKFFHECLKSIWNNQTLKPHQIVLVKDGELTDELEEIIQDWQNQLKDILKIVPLSQNVGLAKALNAGLEHCEHEWVFRMDTDDICTPDRFEKQVAFIQSNPDTVVIGGQIIEFKENIDDSNLLKEVPTTHEKITKYAKSRNPINHMTVAFKKSVVLQMGGYHNAPLYEDYDLWVRLLLNNQKFANLPDILVYARAGTGMYQRRGGFHYAKNEIMIQKCFYNMGFLTRQQLLKNLAVRLPIRLLPNAVRAWVYQFLLRK